MLIFVSGVKDAYVRTHIYRSLTRPVNSYGADTSTHLPNHPSIHSKSPNLCPYTHENIYTAGRKSMNLNVNLYPMTQRFHRERFQNGDESVSHRRSFVCIFLLNVEGDHVPSQCTDV